MLPEEGTVGVGSQSWQALDVISVMRHRMTRVSAALGQAHHRSCTGASDRELWWSVVRRSEVLVSG